MKRTFVTGIAAVLGVLLIVGPAAAQTSQPTVKFNFFEIEGGSLVVGKSLTIDKAYGDARNIAVKAPFRFIAPTSDDFLVGQQPTPGTDTLVKIVYATLDKQFIENFQFSTLTVAMGEEEARLKSIANVLNNQGFGMVVQPYKDPKQDGVRKIKVGPYVAVEVFGRLRTAEQ